MIRLDMPQGSSEWHDARLGIPTSSKFDSILTPKQLKPGKADGYLHSLLAEWSIGEALDSGTTIDMDRGTIAERQARSYYELQRDVDVEQVGFCLTDDSRVGCSPDGLVGEDGGLEIKCLMAKGHTKYLLMDDPSLEHRGQIQGSLWVTGRAWWDLLVWHPHIPSIIHRCCPDPEWVEKWEPALESFIARLDAGKEKFRGLGVDR